MRLELYNGDIFQVSADVLICSANVSLNLSGGVGGELLLRFGTAVQEELRQHLPRQRPHFARLGDVIVTHPRQTPYMAVLHAVAVDAFYDSSPVVISQTVREALRLAAAENARSVALSALATGFGHLSVGQFAQGLRPVLLESYPPVEMVTVAIQCEHDFEELKNSLPEGTIVEPASPSNRR